MSDSVMLGADNKSYVVLYFILCPKILSVFLSLEIFLIIKFISVCLFVWGMIVERSC
jgi:hypothetical protein